MGRRISPATNRPEILRRDWRESVLRRGAVSPPQRGRTAARRARQLAPGSRPRQSTCRQASARDRTASATSGQPDPRADCAAIIGPYFELDLVEAVAGIDGDIVVAALEQAEQAHLVKGPSGRQERRWRFAHQLICQALTTALPQLSCQRFHVRVADAMERLDPAVGRLYRGYRTPLVQRRTDGRRGENRSRPDGAGDAAVLRSTRRTMPCGSMACARDFRRHADSRPAGPSVQERLADLLSRSKAIASTRWRTMRSSSTLYEKIRSPVDQARSCERSGRCTGRAASGPKRLRASTRPQGARRRAADVELAQVYQELGLAAFRSGDNQQAIQWAERAVAAAEAAWCAIRRHARRQAHGECRARARDQPIGVALARSGQLEAARARIEQCVALALEHGCSTSRAAGTPTSASSTRTIEPKRAIDRVVDGLELATKIGAFRFRPTCTRISPPRTARSPTAAKRRARCRKSRREHRPRAGPARPSGGAADRHRANPPVPGRAAAGAGRLSGRACTRRKSGEPQLLFPCYDGLATIHLDRGDLNGPRSTCRRLRISVERAG